MAEVHSLGLLIPITAGTMVLMVISMMDIGGMTAISGFAFRLTTGDIGAMTGGISGVIMPPVIRVTRGSTEG